MSEPLRGVVDCLKSIVSRRHWNDVGDAELVRTFNETHDSDVFACLMRRHGPMVMGLARRVVRDQQLAEDVFQATFLILARKAGSIRGREALPAWLHRVALRLATRARKSRKRLESELEHAELPATSSPLDEITLREYLAILDEEIAKLPEKYRLPLILCHLEGLSQEEAAKRLGTSPDSIRGMLERGRQMLRKRLSSRGLPGVALGTLELGGMSHPVSATLIQTTARAAVTSQGASAAAVALAEGAIMMMTMAKIKTVCVVAALVGVVSFGAGWMAVGAGGVEPAKADAKPPAAPEAQAAVQAKKEPGRAVDLYGDPLPEGAVMRLGTVRWRADGVTLGFLPDSRTLIVPASGSEARIQYWDAVSGTLQREIAVEASNLLSSSAMSRDGKLLALSVNLPHKVDDALIPGEVQIWDLATGKKVKTLKRSGEDVNFSALAFSPDSKLLFSIGKDQMVFIEEIDTGKEILRYKFPKGVVGAASGGSIGSSPDGTLLTIGAPQSFFLWKWQSGDKPLELKNPDRVRRSWTYSPDSKLFLQCGNELRVWDVASGKQVRTLKPLLKGHYFASATYSPDGRTLYFSCYTGEDGVGVVEVWDAATWEFKHRLDTFYVGRVHISPDGRLLAGHSGPLRVWDQAENKELSASDEAHRHPVNLLASFGDLVLTAGEDNTIRLWDVRSGKQKSKMTHAKSFLGIGRRDVALSPDGTKLIISRYDDSVSLWDATTGEQILRLSASGRLGGNRAIAYTPDGKYFLTYGDAGYLRKWESATGKVVVDRWISPDGKQKAIADPANPNPISPIDIINRFKVGGFSADGKSLVLIKPPDIRFFDVDTGDLSYSLHFKERADGLAAFSPDNRLMLVSITGNPIEVKSPDGTLVRITHEKQHMVYLWELSTRSVRMKMVLAGQRPGPMAFSPDGKMFAVGTTEAPGSIRLWDASSGKELPPITGFRGTPRSLAFTSDSTRLISGVYDGTVLVWDLTK